MSSAIKLIEHLVQRTKKDPQYYIDPYLDLMSVIGILWRRGIALLRCLFWNPILIHSKGLVFFGKGFTLRSPHLISVG